MNPPASELAAIELTRERADMLAAGFISRLGERGVFPGSTVAFSAANSPQLLAAIFGSLRAGYAPVVLSAVLTSSERESMLATVDPVIVIDGPLCNELVRPAGDNVPASELDEFFHCRPLHFTSGTSGAPKAVWSGWMSRSAFDRYTSEEQAVWGFLAIDHHLVSAPLSHSAPLRFALHTLLAGGSVLVPPKFEAQIASDLIGSGVVTTAFMAPAHMQRLLDLSTSEPHGLRLLAHAGSACPERVKREAIRRFGEDVIVEFYGSTEGQFTVCPSADWLARPGSVGRARAGRQLRVTAGQIWCHAPEHARFEYWGDPAKTAATWDGDWFTVGDLGRLDDDGYLFLEGRRTDLIITGGVNVYPAEVECILADLPGVDKICVFGIEDQEWGQRVCAVVTGSVTEAQVHGHAKRFLAPYKRPKTVLVTTELPMTHSGKIDRTNVPALLSAT